LKARHKFQGSRAGKGRQELFGHDGRSLVRENVAGGEPPDGRNELFFSFHTPGAWQEG
jgi:hypothetical protein